MIERFAGIEDRRTPDRRSSSTRCSASAPTVRSTGDFAAAVAAANAIGAPILALDIPSGLHADTGWPLGDAIRATATVTFVGLKQGLYLGRACDYTGDIELADLGLPEDLGHDLEPALTRLALRGARPSSAAAAAVRAQGHERPAALARRRTRHVGRDPFRVRGGAARRRGPRLRRGASRQRGAVRDGRPEVDRARRRCGLGARRS